MKKHTNFNAHFVCMDGTDGQLTFAKLPILQ